MLINAYNNQTLNYVPLIHSGEAAREAEAVKVFELLELDLLSFVGLINAYCSYSMLNFM